MKKIIALLFFILLLSTHCFAFTDVNDSELSKTISDLADFGIISGYDDGSFKPYTNITRAEFSKMIICATGYNYFEAENEDEFLDVDYSHWAKGYIYNAKNLGIVSGTSFTTFEPEANITYEQAIKMIVCALGYGSSAVEKGGYPDGYIKIATELGITDSIDFLQKDIATRKNIALMIDKALDVQYNYMYELDGTIITEPSMITLREQHNIRLVNSNSSDEELFIEEPDEILDESQIDSVG